MDVYFGGVRKLRNYAGLPAMHLEDVAFCNTFATPSLKKKFATDEIVSNGLQIK